NADHTISRSRVLTIKAGGNTASITRSISSRLTDLAGRSPALLTGGQDGHAQMCIDKGFYEEVE
ncbi:MAG: hypothetical protein WBO73_18650, partial [Gammaproteobacteria bacterium]